MVRRKGQDLCAESCSICRMLCTGSSSIEGQASVLRDTRPGRKREAPLRKEALHFALSLESYLDMVDCDLNNRILQQL